jgi:hypothetical protein
MNMLECHQQSLQIQGYGTWVSEGFYERPSLNRALGESRNRDFQTPGNGHFSGTEIPPGYPIWFLTLLGMLSPRTGGEKLPSEKFGVGLVCISITYFFIGDYRCLI